MGNSSHGGDSNGSVPLPSEGEDSVVLSTTQQTVIEWLVAGETINAAATAAGVNRTTVFRWMKNDPVFKAAFNAWQADVVATARARLLALTDAAVTAVAGAVQKGDSKLAFQLLRRQGVMSAAKPGPVEPGMVARKQALARRQAEKKQANEEFAAFLP